MIPVLCIISYDHHYEPTFRLNATQSDALSFNEACNHFKLLDITGVPFSDVVCWLRDMRLHFVTKFCNSPEIIIGTPGTILEGGQGRYPWPLGTRGTKGSP